MSDWTGTKNPGKLNTSMWNTPKKKKEDTSRVIDKNGWIGSKKPGKLNTSMWNAPNKKKEDNAPQKGQQTPDKVDIYNEPSPVASPTRSPITKADSAGSEETKTDDMILIPGACQQSGCKCSVFIENSSKWSKGKCNSCIHPSTNHKQEWVKKSSTKAQQISLGPKKTDPQKDKNELLKKSTKKLKKECKTRKLSVEGGKLDCIDRILLHEQSSSPGVDVIAEEVDYDNIEDDDGDHDPFYDEMKEWMKQNETTFDPQFNEKLKENVSKYFEFNAGSILAAKYILHFLKVKVGLDFAECTGSQPLALQYAFMEALDIQVVSKWGYYIQLRDVEYSQNIHEYSV